MIWHKKEHPPSAKDAPRLWIYRNLTPWRIDAHFDARGRVLPQGATPARDGDQSPPAPAAKPAKELSIPPLGEVTVPNVDARDLDTLEMRRLGQLEVRPAPSERLSSLPRAIVIFGWLAVLLFFGGWALFFGGASAVPWRAVAASVVAVPVIALVAAGWRELHVYRRFDRYRRWLATEEGKRSKRSLEGIERGSRVSGFVDGMPRQVAEALVLVSVVTVSVIGLGIAIHQTTQLEDLLPIHYGRLLRLRDPFLDVKALALNSPAFWELLVARIAQWVLVSIAALAPAAMYFQFDRQRLAAVQRRWVHEVFRLDPTVRTVKDIEAKYGSQIESSFGHLGPDSRQRLSNGRR
jgi:hypothetical protein